MEKVLIIPSLCPQNSNHNQGIFTINQAKLLADEYDIRILAGKLVKSSSRIKKLIISIRYILFKISRQDKERNLFKSDLFVYGFSYEKGLNRLVSSNYCLMIDSYINYFEETIINGWKPDIIHAHNTNFAGVVAAEISKRYSIPYIITEHHHLNALLPHKLKKRILKTLENSSQNCFVSDWQYRTYLLAGSKITGVISGNPVNKDKFVPGHKVKDKFIISHLSNADVSKDVDTLINTIVHFFSLIDEYLNVEVKIAGFPDNIISDLKQRLKGFDWVSQIEFLPILEEDGVISLLQKSSVYLHTSFFESFGLAPLEAILCGVPVVSTDNGGINEYLRDGENGVLCKIRDYKELAHSILKIYNKSISFNPDKVRNSIDQKFTNIGFKAFMSNLYEEL